jgi:hypothetical protein
MMKLPQWLIRVDKLVCKPVIRFGRQSNENLGLASFTLATFSFFKGAVEYIVSNTYNLQLLHLVSSVVWLIIIVRLVYGWNAKQSDSIGNPEL